MKKAPSIAEREEHFRATMRESFKLTKAKEKHISHSMNVVLTYMSKQDIPVWYRGKSNFQIEALNELSNAIRDDCEQKTAHRVRNILNILGLEPMVDDRRLKLLMRLSRGNDLAFLWFLMEMCYKTHDEKTYSLNEQMIFSAIAHLDMVTTLRELDRILPPGHENKRMMKHRQKQQDRKRRLEMRRKAELRANKLKNKVSMPYFHKLEKPNMYGKPLAVGRPEFRAMLQEYKIFKDKSYVPVNEINRWYTTYNISTSVRLVRVLLRALIHDVLTLVEHGSSQNTTIKDKVNFMQEQKKLDELKNKRVLCVYHQMRTEEEELERMARVLEAKARRIRCIGSFSKEKEATLKRIQNDLEHQINMYRLHFKRKLQSHIGQENCVRILSRDGYHEYLISDGYQPECKPMQSHSIADSTNGSANKMQLESNINTIDTGLMSRRLYAKKETEKLDTSASSKQRTSFNKRLSDKARHIATAEEKPSPSNGSHTKYRLSFIGQRRGSPSQLAAQQISLQNMQYREEYEYGHERTGEELETPNSSERYFEAPSPHKPYQFKYAKIFRYQNMDETRAFIKEQCVKALSGDVHKVPKLEDFTPNLAPVASQCAKNAWNNAIEAWRLEHPTDDEKIDPLPPPDPYPPDMPRLPFYDCDDKELMSKMLQIALDHMSKNPKFVLASLPEAHKLPYLTEFIAERYGKRYTEAERLKSCDETLELLKSLEQTRQNVPVPKSTDMAKTSIINYICRSYVEEKAGQLMQDYKNRITNALMEHTRILWCAMRGYLCSNGPPRSTFFAYQPARANDIKLFKPWKLSEVRDVKMIWDKRWHKAQKEKKEKI